MTFPVPLLLPTLRTRLAPQLHALLDILDPDHCEQSYRFYRRFNRSQPR